MYRYAIGGIVTVESPIGLSELAYFRTDVRRSPDIRIRVRFSGERPVGHVRLERRGDAITYREHLGGLGANFDLRLGHPIELEVAPLLALSPHVLYTNVVEALIRFTLVAKGYMLLHSAAIETGGCGALLSAETDTGKTSTVIELVRDHGYRFISDDMVIVDPAGFVRTYPKPMTLSYHTMTRAVDASTLPLARRAALQLQSRVHSKSGRSTAKGLAALNVPILSINALVQFVVPPPKYHIRSLLPAEIASEAPIRTVVLMERGEPLKERVGLDEAVDQLIDYTDESYSFPPFSTLAPRLEIAGSDYAALRLREREILTSALRGAVIWRLRVPGHEWPELLPDLVEPSGADAPDPDRPRHPKP